LIRLVAILALINSFFKKNLMITRRKYSDILLRFPRGICTNLPASSKPPSKTRQRKWGLHGGAQPAKNELLNHLGDPLATETAVDDSVFAFVLFSDALKIESAYSGYSAWGIWSKLFFTH